MAAVTLAAAAVGLSLTLAACEEENGAKQRRPPSPPWLGDRICEAAASGDLSRLKQLLAEHDPPEGVNIRHRYGWTPLHTAVANGQQDVVEYILSRPECDPNLTDRYNPRARNWNAESIKHSIRAQHFPQMYPIQPSYGWSALHYAVLFAPLDVVEKVLNAPGLDLERVDDQGLAPENLLDFSRIDERIRTGELDEERRRELEEYRKRMERVVELLKDARKKQAEQAAQRAKEERLRFPLELKLREKMVGQEIPILSVAAALRRRDNGWFDENKPLVFLFLGSSGVGKTMMAKLLADHLVKDKENGFIRIDLSEYQQKHEAARLIGSPPGYVGHESGGMLTTKLAKCPNAVVLLDEVEKAHPDVLTLLLQVFDEGRLTDGKGTTVHCPNSIFIMTSNLVQDEIREAEQNGYLLRPPSGVSLLEDLEATTKEIRKKGGITMTPLGGQTNEEVETKGRIADDKSEQQQHLAVTAPTETLLPAVVPVGDESVSPASFSAPSSSHPSITRLATDTERFLRYIVHPILKRSFRRDEFIGRINDMIIFHDFNSEDLASAVETELHKWSQRARDRHRIQMEWTPALVESLTHAYDERYGYRSLIYGVEKRVVNVLASAHERDRIKSGDLVGLDVAPSNEDHAHDHAQPVVIREIIRGGAMLESKEKKENGRKKFLGIF